MYGHQLPSGSYEQSAQRAQDLWTQKLSGPTEEQELTREPERSTFERALEIVKNFLVIITCMFVLYSLIEVYLFIGRVQEALQELSSHLTLGG